MRELAGQTRIAIAAWAACATLFHLHAAFAGLGEPRQLRAVHLLLLLPLAFLLWPARPGRSPARRPSLPDLVLAALSTIPGLHCLLGSGGIDRRLADAMAFTSLELALAGLVSLLVVEAVRRAVAPALAALLAAGILYLAACEALPGILQHARAPLHDFVASTYRLDGAGVFGAITGVSASTIAIFVAFGAAMARSGIGRFLRNLGTCLAGLLRGGPSMAVAMSSVLFDAIHGPAPAHVLAAGSATIPAMARLGHGRDFAAAMGALSSMGGRLVPPAMGAGAFVMAELAGIPYVQVCIAAALGALLFVLAILARVHFEARRLRLPGVPEGAIPGWREVLRDAPLLLPVLLLMALLLLDLAPCLAASWAFIATFLVSWIHRHPRSVLLVLPVGIAVALALLRFREHDAAWSLSIALGAASLLAMLWSRPGTRPLVREAADVLVVAGRDMVVVALACVGAGMSIALLSATGLDTLLRDALASAGQGNMLQAGSLLMVATLALAASMPAAAACIIAATVGAQVLVALGASVLAAHLFVFHASILAAAASPLSPGCRAAAAIANADPLRTGLAAGCVALAGHVVCLGYLHDPALLMQGPWPAIVATLLADAMGIVLFAAALAGCFREELADPWRAALGVVALVLLFPAGGLEPLARIACALAAGSILCLAPRAFAPVAAQATR
ncbi:MAG: TRAP transporter permease [Alphaproteobacteria bacterium]